MRFSLKWALTAVLAKGIVAEVTHMAHTQKLPNEMDIVSQKQSEFQPHYRQAVQPVKRFFQHISIEEYFKSMRARNG